MPDVGSEPVLPGVVAVADLVNINDVLDGHVSLDLDCIDRLYLNVYVPNLQVGGQVVTFMTQHLGLPVPSPLVFKKLGDRFRAAVSAFAEEYQIPVLRLKRPDRTRWDDRKLDHVAPYLRAAEAEGTTGVVAIVAAQEIQKVFMGYQRDKGAYGTAVNFGFDKADRAVTVYYFYVYDAEFGPGFIKLCSYFPYPGKVWLNGHEWLKRQAERAGLDFTPLANGFASCSDPRRLQRLADRLGPSQVTRFFQRWMGVIPTPLTNKDRTGGYWWELSMRQVEVSRTLVFDDPRPARGFFESLVADNVGVGRPERVAVVFARQIRKTTKEPFRTRVFGPGTEVKLDFSYKHSRVKQYLKEGRALRIETVVNKPYDIGVLARLEHLPELVAKARQVNHRLLMIERAGQGCALGDSLFERLQQPYAWEGQRTGALRFGDQRAMALAGALCVQLHAVAGFTNKSLRSLVAGLLGTSYTSSQMTYDLRRLRLHGLITRLPGTNTYVTTEDGLRAAIFYTKVHDRVLRPILSPPTPRPSLGHCVPLSRSSTGPSPTTSQLHTLGEPPETCHIVPGTEPQERLAFLRPRPRLGAAEGRAVARTVIIGGGVVGLGLGMMLAKDGHDVLQLERDPEPPPATIDAAWERWTRRGVAQFRLGHVFLPRWRSIIQAELPGLLPAMEAAGALRSNPLLGAPQELHGGERPDDSRYELVTGRRVIVEKIVADEAERTPGLTVRRGTAVTGLATGPSLLGGVPHITGVRTEGGSEIAADVVIDASGRRSALPSWLIAQGVRPPVEEVEDSGFVYYARHYRSDSGAVPVALGGALQNCGSISSLTLAADNGYWAVILVARADDAALRRLKDAAVWERVVRALPTVAHWLDGEPVEDRIVLMSKIEDRIRHLHAEGRPVATGLLLTGDSWACTNPSLGRGASIGTMQAVIARDCLRAADDPVGLVESYATATKEVVEPWYRTTLSFDRARLDEMGQIAAGSPDHGVPPDYEMTRALEASMLKDPDCFRAMLDVAFVHDLPEAVLSRPGIQDKVVELGGAWRDSPRSVPTGTPCSRSPTRRRADGFPTRVTSAGVAAIEATQQEEKLPGMRADNGGTEIHYEVAGEGKPVFLLHGFPDSGRVWRNQVPALAAAGFRVLVPDLRGYGASDKPAAVEDYSMRMLAGDVHAIFEAEGIGQADVVGHDWGAALAWAIAGMVPERVDHLVAMSVGHPGSFRGSGFDQLEKSWYMLLFLFPGIAERWLSDNDWANFRSWGRHPDADGVIADLVANGSLTPGLNYYRANVAPESYLTPPVALPPVQAPTMGMWSSKDIALTEGQMLRSEAHVAGAWRYERVDGAGHWMQLDAPEVVNRLLLDFLALD